MKLSQREQELYDLIVLDGLNLKEAAKAMFVEMSTVKKHLHHIFLKTQCASQRELIHKHYKEYCNG